jgi:hypothetical protein
MKKQIRFVAKMPEQVWNQGNMENMTALEQRQDWNTENRRKLEHGKQKKTGTKKIGRRIRIRV